MYTNAYFMILWLRSLSVNAASVCIFKRNYAHIFIIYLYTQMCLLGTVQCLIFRSQGTAVLGSGEAQTEGPQNGCFAVGSASAECGAKLKES